MSGDWANAQALTTANAKIDKKYNSMLCDLWNRIAANASPSSDRYAAVKNMSSRLKCTVLLGN